MYFVGIFLLLALLALCVVMLLKDGTLVLPGTSTPAPAKTEDDAADS